MARCWDWSLMTHCGEVVGSPVFGVVVDVPWEVFHSPLFYF